MDGSKHRWFCPAPSWLVYGSLLMTALLFLSERWRWFTFNAHKGWTVLVAVAGLGVMLLAMLLWWLVGLIFQRQFQIGIRTLLVLVVAVALPFSWLGAKMNEAREQKQAVRRIRGVIYSCVVNGFYSYPGAPQPNGPEWLRAFLGDDFFNDPYMAMPSNDMEMELATGLTQLTVLNCGPAVTDAGLQHCAWLVRLYDLKLNGTRITDAGLQYLAGLSQLHDLRLDKTSVTDAGLANLRKLSQIEWLELDDTAVTAVGMEYLASMYQLRQLDLSNTMVTDDGLKYFKEMSQLQVLRLNETKVTDAGLQDLALLGNLRGLYLVGTKVTDEGVNKLQRELPDCSIYH